MIIKPKPAKTGNSRNYSVPALEKSIDIFELIAGESAGLTISETAFRLKRSLSEIFRIMVVLERRQWLQKDPETSRYAITYRVLELAHNGTPAQAMSLIAAPVMHRLSKRIKQSCHVVVPAGGHGLVMLRQENVGRPGGFAMRLGSVVELPTSCPGRVLLAGLDGEAREALLRLIPTPWGVRKEELLKQLARVKRRGFEAAPSSIASGVTEVSYPIRARDEKVVGALTVPYQPGGRNAALEPLDAVRGLLDQAAQEISKSLALIR